VDLKPFSFDRITFDMEHLGDATDRKAAAAARQAALDVWNLIDSKFVDSNGMPDWSAALDDGTKEELDKNIRTIVRPKIIAPFKPQQGDAGWVLAVTLIPETELG
jgi:hypothetical protein